MEFPETRNDYAFKLQKEIQTWYSTPDGKEIDRGVFAVSSIL